ncbi:MAG: putative glycoside hydrolase [bacterium]|nr:putative glycoside hydrolase [bacterium]
MMKISWRSSVLIFGVGFLIAVGAAAASESVAPKISFVRSEGAPEIPAPAPEAPPPVEHIKTPDAVRGIYMSQCAAGTPSFRTSFLKMLDETSLNAIVIDIRDYSGKIAFPTENPVLKDMVSDECGARDMKEWVQLLHDHDVYVIGRITVFQNPAYTKLHPEQAVQKKGGGVWKDKNGLAFVDVGAKEYWSTVVELAKESYELGFDELNFDYIRFPSDGDMKAAVYSFGAGKSKAEALEEFFKYLHENLEPLGIITSADLFGYVTVHDDDLGIGQILERALPYFDYIDPMVYPSHYNSGFAGLKNVNSDPYKVVAVSMNTAVERTIATTTRNQFLGAIPVASTSPQLYEKKSYPASAMRPWLQSFDYPVEYTPAMVAAQIKANEDAGLTSYLFWDAANKYRSLRQVLTQ